MRKILYFFIVFVALLIICPLIIVFLWSIASRWPWPNILPTSYTLRGLLSIFYNSSSLFSVVISSVILSLIVGVLATIIALLTTRALVFYNFLGKNLVSFSTILPIIVPSTALVMGIHVFFIKIRLADTILGVIIIHLIYSLPYAINIINDVMEIIGDKLEVQSNVLGVEPKKSFFYVTFPLLIPAITSSIAMSFIISFSQYFITLFIGGGKVKTLSLIMVPYIQSGDRTIGASYSLLFLFSALVVFFFFEFIIVKIYKSRWFVWS